jgi:TM2 domain-containing membrane protein YozV
MARRTVYKERKRLNAAILAFFGGFLGLHKFYLRETGAGFFYIMLTFITAKFFIPASAILGIFDAMKLLMMPDSEFDRKYNRNLLKKKRDHRSTSRSQVVDRPTKRVRNNPFKKSGIKKYKEFYVEESIEDFEKALEVDPGDPDIHFNLGGAYSLIENKDKAFFHIAKAVELGFKPVEKIKTNDDLAYLRIQPEFEQFQASNYRTYAGASTGKAIPQRSGKQENLLDQDVLLSQLNKLKELREKGILTQNDFEVESKKLMRRR